MILVMKKKMDLSMKIKIKMIDHNWVFYKYINKQLFIFYKKKISELIIVNYLKNYILKNIKFFFII